MPEESTDFFKITDFAEILENTGHVTNVMLTIQFLPFQVYANLKSS